MSTFPATRALKFNDVPVYIDLECGDTTTWSPAEEAEYGPIEDQGCDRCESGQARWVAVRVEL